MPAPSVTQSAVRKFWCDSYQSMVHQLQGSTPNEAIAIQILRSHPEFHSDLSLGWASVAKVYDVTQVNPFLHLSLHLSVQEQLSSDMPAGIRRLFAELSTALCSPHEAEHVLAECLGDALARVAAMQTAPDPNMYLADVERRLAEARSRH